MMECFAGIWVIYFWSTYLYYYYYVSKFLISSHVSAGSGQSFWLWYMAFLTTNKNKVSCHKQVVIMFEYLLWILDIPACLHILIHISVISKLRYNDSVLNFWTFLQIFMFLLLPVLCGLFFHNILFVCMTQYPTDVNIRFDTIWCTCMCMDFTVHMCMWFLLWVCTQFVCISKTFPIVFMKKYIFLYKVILFTQIQGSPSIITTR